MILLSKAAKSRRVSSRHCRRSSSCCCFEVSWAAVDASGGGVGGNVGGSVMGELGANRRLVIRLKVFSSTLSRRDLCRASR